jgi:hypothetical protein
MLKRFIFLEWALDKNIFVIYQSFFDFGRKKNKSSGFESMQLSWGF